MADDMAAFGLQDEIEEAPRESEIEAAKYEIWVDNLPTLNVFLRLENRWNVVAAPDGEMVRTGIWFPNMEGALRTTNGVPKRAWPGLIADLEAMEDAALAVMSQARQERREKRLREMESNNK